MYSRSKTWVIGSSPSGRALLMLRTVIRLFTSLLMLCATPGYCRNQECVTLGLENIMQRQFISKTKTCSNRKSIQGKEHLGCCKQTQHKWPPAKQPWPCCTYFGGGATSFCKSSKLFVLLKKVERWHIQIDLGHLIINMVATVCKSW